MKTTNTDRKPIMSRSKSTITSNITRNTSNTRTNTLTSTSNATSGFGGITKTKLTRRSRSCTELQKLRKQANENKPPSLRVPLTRAANINPPTLSRNNTTIGSNRTLGNNTTIASNRSTRALTANTANKEPPKTGSASVPAKKIPPYDYKARFLDLLERHKPMKEQLQEITDKYDTALEQLKEYEEAADKLKQFEELCKSQQETIESLQKQRLTLLHRYEKEVAERRSLKQKLKDAHFQLNERDAKLEDLSERLQIVETKYEDVKDVAAKQKIDIEEYQDSVQQLHWERRQLHNKIQDMKGNIRVICRVRPALALDRPVASMTFPDVCTIELERLESGNRQRLAKYDFKFDHVFGPNSSQDDIWEEVSCLIQSAIDGYNVCIFAYGQTGSGKTYTMEGTGDSPGVIPKTCTMLFDSIKQMSKSGWEYKVFASFLEIYNEQLFDLLQSNRDSRDLDIRMVDAKGTDVYVTNMHEEEVGSALELLQLCAKAAQRRQTAATASNERSSRSHSVSRIKLVAYHKDKNQQLQARLCLVDLAGSESAKLSGRIEETKNINRSLSELGQVILALQQKKEHVPFRNSKLTRLLEPQLGGAAKALLVAAAAPYMECSQETLNTLRFAMQVGNCSTAAARRNIAIANPTMQASSHN